METKDYVNPADGLLYCGKCHTPRQCRVTAFGQETIQYCTCKCEQKHIAEEKAWREKQKKQHIAACSQRNSCAKSKKVVLLMELDNGTYGHITGSIREEKR